MPQKIKCGKCNKILYEGDILKSPGDIAKRHDGKCPECGKELRLDTKSIDIYPAGNAKETQKPPTHTKKTTKTKKRAGGRKTKNKEAETYRHVLGNLSFLIEGAGDVVFDDIKTTTKLGSKKLNDILKRYEELGFVEFYKEDETEYVGLTLAGDALVDRFVKKENERALLSKYPNLPDNYRQLLKKLYNLK